MQLHRSWRGIHSLPLLVGSAGNQAAAVGSEPAGARAGGEVHVGEAGEAHQSQGAHLPLVDSCAGHIPLKHIRVSPLATNGAAYGFHCRLQGRMYTLPDVWIRPAFGGKGRKMTGTLEAHANGFRYNSPKGESLDIMYRCEDHSSSQRLVMQVSACIVQV